MNKQIRESLAIHGGRPVRTRSFRPTHDFGEKDATAVSKIIMSGQMGRGPVIDQFEAEAEFVRSPIRHWAGRLRLRKLDSRSLT